MHLHVCQGNWVAIDRAVVHYTQADHASSVGIKCWYCSFCSLYFDGFEEILNRKHMLSLLHTYIMVMKVRKWLRDPQSRESRISVVTFFVIFEKPLSIQLHVH